ENLRAMHHHKLALAFDAILVLGPEHVRVFTEGGWDRTRIVAELEARLQLPYAEIVRGAGGIAEGIPDGLGLESLPKFSPGGLMLAHAGGGAGLFSMLIAGWVNGDSGSRPVTRAVQY
ncbi:MAG: thioredoxin, partial [Ilumatobacteraceae bacterium]